MGWGGVNISGKSVTKVQGSMLLALRGGGWGSDLPKKRYVTLEWPLSSDTWHPGTSMDAISEPWIVASSLCCVHGYVSMV